MLKGKTIVLGVTGGIAAYKAASLASLLVKQHADVQVLMTENATKFITPITFEQLTGNKALVDTFDRNFQDKRGAHRRRRQGDFVLIAPATANVIAKLTHGIADDMLTTTVLACDCPKAIAPAMNTKMYENPVTQDNLAALRRYGWEVVEPASGRLACGAVGKGKLPEPEALLETCLHGPRKGPRPASGCWSPPAPPRSRWTRCAISRTTPPAAWATPSPRPPPAGAPRSRWSPDR